MIATLACAPASPSQRPMPDGMSDGSGRRQQCRSFRAKQPRATPAATCRNPSCRSSLRRRPRRLPLFPLGTVLFPGGFMPLRIFEVRYLDLINKCHKSGAPFGVVSLTQGTEVRRAGAQTERFADVGTLATIRSFDVAAGRPAADRMRRQQRFRIHSSAQQQYGLWTAQVESIDGRRRAGHSRRPAPCRRRAASAWSTRWKNGAACRPWTACGCRSTSPIASTIAAGSPTAGASSCRSRPQAKQRLLELDSPLMRLELVSDLLAHTGIAE